MRRFELIEGKSSKFWEVEPAGSDLNLRWGRIGTAGQSQTKSFADEAKARAALDKLVKEKTGKGYAEVAVAAGAGIGATAPKPATAAAPQATNAAASPMTPPGDASERVDTDADADAVAVVEDDPAAAVDTALTAEAEAHAEPELPQTASLDAQCDQVFNAVREQIVSGEMAAGETVSATQLKRRFGVSERGEEMESDLLKSNGLLYGWGKEHSIHESAQARAAAIAPRT
ncbi:WGR domain-containing protein, partial [Burkholderia sp. Ac-20379]|uniref:WGR domain-containing protein n=1 Tax=Burkholderia sp. Ac-20379 TaxID=2703900 RepID=UPI00197FF685